MSDYGWVDLKELIDKCNQHNTPITEEIIRLIVETDDKERYTIENNKIRANQGHSIKVDIEFEQRTPPDVLYHGTKTSILNKIFQDGLSKMKRNHVHLSAELITAQRVADRRKDSKSVILEIDSKKMREDSYVFLISKNNVWLTDNVPPQYLRVKNV